MTIAESHKRALARSDRLLAVTAWTFAIVEAVGIAVMLWRW